MSIKKSFILFVVFTLLILGITSCKEKPTIISTSEFSESSISEEAFSDTSYSVESGESSSDNNSEIKSNSDSSTSPNFSIPTGNVSSTLSSISSTSGSEYKLEYFNVTSYGAKGTGTVDDSGAIKKAILAAKNADGGIVYLPSGMYLVNSGIDIPMGVSVRGESPSTVKKWKSPTNLGTSNITFEQIGVSWLDSSNFSGSWIIVNHGSGDVDSHATFELQGNSSIYSLGFVHKNSAPIVSKITIYPPAIGIKNIASNPYTRDGMTIEDIVLLNAYVGIGVQAGNGKLLDHQNGQDADLFSMGRLRVHDVSGGCTYRGIIMKGLLDTIDLENVNFGYTNIEKTYVSQRTNNCADFEWYRADGSNATNIFSFGAKYGILTTPAFKNGSSSMRLSKAELIGQYPLYITATGQYEIEDSTFTSINFNNLCVENDFRPMTVIQDTTSVHQPLYVFNQLTLINGIKSTSLKDESLRIVTNSPSAPAMVMFSDTVFSGWSPDIQDPIISYETPSTSYTGLLSFYNCTFKDGISSSGILFKLTKVPVGGLQFNNCSIPQALINNSANILNAAWIN